MSDPDPLREAALILAKASLPRSLGAGAQTTRRYLIGLLDDAALASPAAPRPEGPDARQRLGWWLRNAFGPAVEAAGHPDPMTEEDWFTMADGALAALSEPV